MPKRKIKTTDDLSSTEANDPKPQSIWDPTGTNTSADQPPPDTGPPDGNKTAPEQSPPMPADNDEAEDFRRFVNAINEAKDHPATTVVVNPND